MSSLYYAVAVGKNPGVYNSWDECKLQILGYPNAKYKGFDNLNQAKKFVEKFQASKEYGEITEKDESIKTYAFVDGSFNSETDTYGYGGFLIHKEDDGSETKTIIQGSGTDENMAKMRNVAGEISGATKAIEKAVELGYDSITIFYDYAGIEEWATGAWKAKKPGTNKYHNFIQQYKKKINISFVKVAGHTGIAGNEEVDKLAKESVGIPID